MCGGRDRLVPGAKEAHISAGSSGLPAPDSCLAPGLGRASWGLLLAEDAQLPHSWPGTLCPRLCGLPGQGSAACGSKSWCPEYRLGDPGWPEDQATPPIPRQRGKAVIPFWFYTFVQKQPWDLTIAVS